MTSRKIKTEILAGITTFFTMLYIVVVNPTILSTPGTGMPFNGVLTATVLTCFTMTLLMGVYARLPFAVAPGMGLNAFLTFTVILSRQIPWPIALGAVFWSGVFFLLTSFTPVRIWIAQALPPSLRIAATTGIGIFISFIGLKNAGFIAADPVTFVKLGHLDRRSMLSLLGLFVTIFLLQRKNPFALLAGILAVTGCSWILGIVQVPERMVSLPDFSSVFMKLDIWGALQWSLLPTMVSILFTDLFDSISTFISVSQASGLLNSKGEPKNLREGLIVDSWATLTAGLFGTSPGTAYIESSAGIEAGGRTGLTSVVTALCFLPCFFLGPLAGMIPSFATAPVLILVGAFMFRSIVDLKTSKLEDLIPAFLTVVLIPLTLSITQGILWGFISHTVLYFFSGRRKELHPMLIGISLVSIGLLVLEHGT